MSDLTLLHSTNRSSSVTHRTQQFPFRSVYCFCPPFHSFCCLQWAKHLQEIRLWSSHAELSSSHFAAFIASVHPFILSVVCNGHHLQESRLWSSHTISRSSPLSVLGACWFMILILMLVLMILTLIQESIQESIHVEVYTSAGMYVHSPSFPLPEVSWLSSNGS